MSELDINIRVLAEYSEEYHGLQDMLKDLDADIPQNVLVKLQWVGDDKDREIRIEVFPEEIRGFILEIIALKLKTIEERSEAILKELNVRKD